MLEDDSWPWSSVDSEGCEPAPSWSSCDAGLWLAEGDVGGEIVESGPVGDVFASPRHSYTRALLDAVPRLDATGRAAR